LIIGEARKAEETLEPESANEEAIPKSWEEFQRALDGQDPLPVEELDDLSPVKATIRATI
jgi:hypothetical protein